MAIMLDHDVEYGEQLAHAGGEGHLLGFAGLTQALVEVTQDWIVSGGHQSRHVQGCPHLPAPSPHRAFSPQRAAVPVEGRHTYQCGDLTTVQRPQFGQVGQEGHGQNRPHARSATEQLVFVSPHGRGAHEVFHIPVQVLQTLFQPANVLLDLGAYTRGGSSKPVFLRSYHLHQLASSGHQRPQFLRGVIGQGSGGWAHRLGKVGQHLGVQRIGFGQFPRSTGEVPHMPGVNYCYGQLGRSQFSRQDHFHSTGSFQHHQLGRQLSQTFHQVVDPTRVMRELPCLTGRPYRHIQAVLGDIDANKQRELVHSSTSLKDVSPDSGPTLPNSGSYGPLNCSGSEQVGRDDPAEGRSSRPRTKRSGTSMFKIQGRTDSLSPDDATA